MVLVRFLWGRGGKAKIVFLGWHVPLSCLLDTYGYMPAGLASFCQQWFKPSWQKQVFAGI